MYLNERAWNERQDDPYITRVALHDFLEIYKVLVEKYCLEGIYIPESQEMQLKSVIYPLARWMADTDKDERMRLMSLWNRRVTYRPERECEVLYENMTLFGATEAVLSDSFVISPCLLSKWKTEKISGNLYTLADDKEEPIEIANVFNREQLENVEIQQALQHFRIPQIYSYDELWRRRKEVFPKLFFCPSVEEDLKQLETSYIHQVIRKLLELEQYCEKYLDIPFQKELLSKTTPESEETLKRYKKEHTFRDEAGNDYVASWHMRFTGIPGRIFFIPDYSEEGMLVCYIGKKLKTVLNPKN